MTSTRCTFVICPLARRKRRMAPRSTSMPSIETSSCRQSWRRVWRRTAPIADRRGGSIHLAMFQDLLRAEFVIADLTLDNPNVWYEIGVRHALRAGGAVLTYALRDRLPFDIAGQRMQRYTLKGGRLAPEVVE